MVFTKGYLDNLAKQELKTLEDRTVDKVQSGEQQPDSDHFMTSLSSSPVYLQFISDTSHKQLMNILYPFILLSACCSVVVQLLFSCCPLFNWTTSEEGEDMKRTWKYGESKVD